MEPGLQSLLLCTDDTIVRVLRRVLSELEIGVEQCADLDTTVQKMTRQRFEAVIVDCTSQELAAKALKGIRNAPANKRAIIIAIIEGQNSAKGATELGAHFVLFKPISLERTRSSFRAVRALMKRERRRHARIPIEIPVELQLDGGKGSVHSVTSDLGENGIAIKTAASKTAATKSKDQKLPPSFLVRFTLPGGSGTEVDTHGEVAWEGSTVVGVRFRDLAPEMSEALKLWIARQLMGSDADEPTVSCALTDLSLSACYLQTESPFPVRTRLHLVMKLPEMELQIEGIVRIMHPGAGMGLEFSQNTPTQKTSVEEFIQTLVTSTGTVPNLQVRPDAIDNSPSTFSLEETGNEQGDPLLSLFRNKSELSADLFHAELRKQRGAAAEEDAELVAT
jgi:ActR/RegA family two-component response regulator